MDPAGQQGGAADELARVSFEVMGRLARLAAEADLSLTQLRMLAILRDRRPRMAELAAALGIDRSSVSGLIGRAEQRGLVTREAATSDGRGVSVALTPTGRKFVAPLELRSNNALEPLLANLAPAERQTLERLLAQITDQQR
ncbi:MarR family winged helix-turn-helix transcriptional regulator [Nakamurella panacisegetis]|uniref:MarR family winged helix-turn-helix transcriptional regulator n=1 Tax=Nakamurella panacisegetis TaxID=1090615 RepID=UPI0018D29334|nr:MarR family transcriptional regulator [Nakamurella panacisegetis]